VRTSGALFDSLLSEFRAGSLSASSRSFVKGEVVFHEGDLGDSIHLVTNGMFAVRTATPAGTTLILDVLDHGDVFGEFAVFSPSRRRTSDITTLSEGGTLEITRDDLRATLENRIDITEGFVSMIVEKADHTSRRLVDLLYIPAELRVLRAVLELAGNEEGVEVGLTQQDLASFAATTRPTANRVLREEAARGTISIARGRISVVDAKRLARRAKVELDAG
jgi:CRP-like cAMP-binding protein